MKHSIKYLIKTADMANRSFPQTKSCLSLRENNLNCVSKKWVRNIWSAEKYNIHFVCFMFSFNIEFFFQRGTNRSHFLSVFEEKLWIKLSVTLLNQCTSLDSNKYIGLLGFQNKYFFNLKDLNNDVKLKFWTVFSEIQYKFWKCRLTMRFWGAFSC